MKAVLVLALGTAAVIFILFFGLHLAGIFAQTARSDPTIVTILGMAFASLLLAGFIALLQIAALCLLRLLPWRGPALEVRDEIDLARVFE